MGETSKTRSQDQIFLPLNYFSEVFVTDEGGGNVENWFWRSEVAMTLTVMQKIFKK